MLNIAEKSIKISNFAYEFQVNFIKNVTKFSKLGYKIRLKPEYFYEYGNISIELFEVSHL